MGEPTLRHNRPTACDRAFDREVFFCPSAGTIGGAFGFLSRSVAGNDHRKGGAHVAGASSGVLWVDFVALAGCAVAILGFGGLGLVAERDGQGKQDGSSTSSRKKRAQRPPETHVANALRSAYEETVREDVPDEFLLLLGKLS